MLTPYGVPATAIRYIVTYLTAQVQDAGAQAQKLPELVQPVIVCSLPLSTSSRPVPFAGVDSRHHTSFSLQTTPHRSARGSESKNGDPGPTQQLHLVTSVFEL